MIAISLWQPWASALFALREAPARGTPEVPVKRYETRGWHMPRKYVGQRVAIHAAKRWTNDEREFWRDTVLNSTQRAMYAEAFARIGVRSAKDLPLGCIIGEVVFECSRPTEDLLLVPDWIESQWGNFYPGRAAWPTVERRHYGKPIPCVGRQGFFVWEGGAA